MNFIGHAAVARWYQQDPRWILGAMLPDFASMSRARIAQVHDPVVAAGVAFHHRTDEVFHGAPGFLDAQRKGLKSLEQYGIQRGPARALAHVGVELLIDGLLLDDAGLCDGYLCAIEVPLEVTFRRGGDRFAGLRGRLRSVGLPSDYRSPPRVAFRLHQILASRPRLAFPKSDMQPVIRWLEEAREELQTGLRPLLEQVREGLGSVDTPQTAHGILRHRAT